MGSFGGGSNEQIEAYVSDQSGFESGRGDLIGAP